MNNHAPSLKEDLAQDRTMGCPCLLEGRCRDRHITNGQVMPGHAAAHDCFTKVGYGEFQQFLRLDQGKERLRPPGADRVKVEIEVTVPRTRHGMQIALSGAEGHPDLATHAADGNRRNLKGMGHSCSYALNHVGHLDDLSSLAAAYWHGQTPCNASR
jgi:hypothetical protein